MKYFIGLDVSMKDTNACIVNELGKIIQEGVMTTDPQSIKHYIDQSRLPIEKIALESGCLSTWLAKSLIKEGLPVVCIDARHVSTFLKLKINKTDKNDARGIAEALRCNIVKEIHLESNNSVEKSSLVGTREYFSSQKTCVTNTIRGLFKAYGIRLVGSATTASNKATASFLAHAEKEAQNLNDIAKFSLLELISCARTLHEKVKEFDKKIAEITKDDSEVQLLKTAPGVGNLTALIYTMIIDDPSRFKKSRLVGAYLGMTPKEYSSGEISYKGRISKCGPGSLRRLLRQSGSFILTRSKKNSKLKIWGLKLKKKIGRQKASLAVGRKLATIMHKMLLTGKEFEFEEEKELESEIRKLNKKSAKIKQLVKRKTKKVV